VKQQEIEKKIEQGNAGEKAMYHWLNGAGLSNLYVNQDPDTYASLFKKDVKRPALF
jgi:hypothetical protein